MFWHAGKSPDGCSQDFCSRETSGLLHEWSRVNYAGTWASVCRCREEINEVVRLNKEAIKKRGRNRIEKRAGNI